MNKHALCFVILTYKPDVEALRRLVTMLAPYPRIVVDNTPEISSLTIKDAHVIESKKNLGYAGGMNVGIKKALSLGVDWVVLLNDDILLSNTWGTMVTSLLATLAPGIAGPFVGKLDEKRYTSIFPANEKHFDYISGSCVAIHKTIFSTVGYFWEQYFLYYEDIEFSLRTKKAGYPLQKLPEEGITHLETKTIGQGSSDHEYYMARNHLLFVRRNAPIHVKLYEFLRLPKTLWEHARRHEYTALYGIKDYVVGQFGMRKGIV